VFDDALAKVFRDLFWRLPKLPFDPDLEMIEALAKFYDFSKPLADLDSGAGLQHTIAECLELLGADTPEIDSELGCRTLKLEAKSHCCEFCEDPTG
jgi:hypothetical protein